MCLSFSSTLVGLQAKVGTTCRDFPPDFYFCLHALSDFLVSPQQVQRLGSMSSAGIPTPRVPSSLSSTGVPAPSSLSSAPSAREVPPRLPSALSSAGEQVPGPGGGESAAGDLDSWSSDDELNFAPQPRKVCVLLWQLITANSSSYCFVCSS